MKYLNLLLLLSLVFFFSCDKKKENNKNQVLVKSQKTKPFVVAIMPTLDGLPFFLADHSGILREKSLEVRLKVYQSQMDCDTALLRGRVHGIVTDLVRAERMKKQKLPLEYFTSTILSWQLYTNRIARIKTLPQLSEKMVGMARFSGTDYWTDVVVKEGKPKQEVFKVQLNDLNIRWKMLQNNEIDAVWMPEPFATKARLAKHQMIYDTADKGIMLGVVAFNEEKRVKLLKDNKLKELVEVYNQMCDSLNKNGVSHYSEVLTTYYQLDSEAIKALPKLRFHHVQKPRMLDINTARNFLN